MKRNSFIFFASYYDAIKNLPDDEQGVFYKIFVEYAIAGRQPKKMTPTIKACFLLIKPFLDNSLNKYDASVENGKKGGRPKKQTETKPKENPSITQQKPSENLNRNRYRNSNIYNIKENNKLKEKNNPNNENIDVVVDENEICLNNLLDKVISLRKKYVEQNEMFLYLAKLFERIHQEESFTIKNKTYSSDEILKHFDNLFIGSDNDIIDRFICMLTQISQANNISNRFKYSVSVMYTQANKIIDNTNYTPAKKDDFIHNHYTKEQISSLITDLDNLEV